MAFIRETSIHIDLSVNVIIDCTDYLSPIVLKESYSKFEGKFVRCNNFFQGIPSPPLSTNFALFCEVGRNDSVEDCARRKAGFKGTSGRNDSSLISLLLNSNYKSMRKRLWNLTHTFSQSNQQLDNCCRSTKCVRPLLARTCAQ